MGAYLDKPKTDKASHSDKGESLSYGLSSMQGWRMEMEDAHSNVLSLPSPFESWSFFGVFDGHAGGETSVICSQKLLRTIMETDEFMNMELDKSGDPVDMESVRSGITKGFMNLDEQIALSTEYTLGLHNSGSTAITAFITPNYIIFANCGDSRAILTRNNAVHFGTQDHKPTNEVERLRIRSAGGIVKNSRVNGSLAVSRSLGDFDFKKCIAKSSSEQMVSPEPEITVIQRSEEEDQLMVLACDGIWDVMSNDQLSNFILYKCKFVSDLAVLSADVIDHCLNLGSKDNMSLIIITTKNVPRCEVKEVAFKEAFLQDIPQVELYKAHKFEIKIVNLHEDGTHKREKGDSSL